MRARLVSIGALLVTILWAFGESHRAMASRQIAREADQEWRSQAVKLSTTRDSWSTRQSKEKPVANPSLAAASPSVASPRPVPSTSEAAATAVPSPTSEPSAVTQETPQLLALIRRDLSRCKVRVEECRIGPAASNDGNKNRTVRLKLVGGKESLKRALFALKDAPHIDLTAARFEPIRKGEARAIVTGICR